MAQSELRPGDEAPQFELQQQTGERWDLNAALTKGPVVLFFYPRDETAICTKEACSFRDAHEDFARQGAQVVGISSDSIESHQRFAERHHLPYVLLSDPGGRVRELFGIKKTFGLVEGRVTFVIDQQRIVRHTFRSALNATRHVEDALDTIRKLAR